MKRNLRLAAYIVIGLALIGVTWGVPAAWATSARRGLGQTVPTRTPTPIPGLTIVPPTEAPATRPPTGQPPTGEPPATAAPGATAAPATATPAPATMLLTKEADRTVVWPGLDITFTLALTNQGATSVRDIVLEDVLPAGMTPGEIRSPGATWDGRTLRARTPVLAPGGRFVVTFTARVRDDLVPGGIIINQAAATAIGAQRATASLVLVPPPAELPPTGCGHSVAHPAP